MECSQEQVVDFQKTMWGYYRTHGRHDLPWRLPEPGNSFDPYKVMVSELMLQQTQVGRVIPKYLAFLERFPDAAALAGASLGDVLRVWQGLGYNRRAKFLWQAAQMVQPLGAFPQTFDGLVKLPGVGINTAGAIAAYSWNQPVIFVETNVRTVYIHHFFADQYGIHDTDIRHLLEQTLDYEHPRQFYWAVMDYGSYLKSTVGNLNTASTSYSKQSRFQGSKRQIRGQVIRLLGLHPRSLKQLTRAIPDERLGQVVEELKTEGLIKQKQGMYGLE